MRFLFYGSYTEFFILPGDHLRSWLFVVEDHVKYVVRRPPIKCKKRFRSLIFLLMVIAWGFVCFLYLYKEPGTAYALMVHNSYSSIFSAWRVYIILWKQDYAKIVHLKISSIICGSLFIVLSLYYSAYCVDVINGNFTNLYYLCFIHFSLNWKKYVLCAPVANKSDNVRWHKLGTERCTSID